MLLGLAAARGLWRPVAGPAIDPAPDPSATRPLGDSLAEATSATWELAREASAPAARIGRVAWIEAPAPSPAIGVAPPSPSPGVLREVGSRVGAGVRPLSGTARNAFGFLLDPVLADRDGA